MVDGLTGNIDEVWVGGENPCGLQSFRALLREVFITDCSSWILVVAVWAAWLVRGFGRSGSLILLLIAKRGVHDCRKLDNP